MTSDTKSSLFLRVTIFFFSFLLIYTLVIGFVFLKSALSFEKEVNQKLNKDIAVQIAKDASPFLNGSVNEGKVQDLMHYLMTVNPGLEIYVLDETGNILTFVAPNKVVQLKKVSLTPILRFIESTGNNFSEGDDPRNPGKSKVFSAAPVMENNKLLGYVYVILASQEYDGIASNVKNSSFLQLAVKTLGLILIISLVIGVIVFKINTKNLSHIIRIFRMYMGGDMKARIHLPSASSEYTVIEKTFNDMADSLEKKIVQIHEVDTFRKELIANISHDLRTPIASILGYTELLIDKNTTLSAEDRAKYLAIIDTNSNKMKKQIQDLFELSKLESAHYKLHVEPLHLGELITDISNKYKLLANERGINLNTIFSKDLPTINADIALMDRVIQNLVDNALKFSKGGDTINIEIGQTAKNILVKISDTGEGIAEEDLPYIFDRFRIGKNNETSNTGLGLAIVRAIVE
ncbi:MAG: HAMP domain-containing sensor histidine kinase, partial [Saprospiraceae bacterium]